MLDCDNYQSLLNINYKERVSLFVLPFLIIIIICLSCLIEIYDSVSFIYIKNDGVTISVPIENSDYVINGDYLVINKQKYNYEITNISSILSEGGISFQNYSINIDNLDNTIDNQVGTVTFYSNKETIIKKILKVFFWKG